MIASHLPLTYEDLLSMPDDGKRREIIGGELIVNPAPRRDHQEIVGSLHWILQRFLRASDWGRVYTHPVDVYLGHTDTVQPDLIVIRKSRLDIYRPEGVVVEPPDLVIEILSPSTRAVDLVRKMALYSRSGVPEYWIADPDKREIVVNVLLGDEYVPVTPDAEGVIASSILSGLRIDPAEVFSGLDT